VTELVALCLVFVLLASACTAADDVARAAQRIAHGARRADAADDLAARLRRAATSTSLDDVQVAQTAEDVFQSQQRSRVAVSATTTAQKALPSVDRHIVEQFVLGASCETLDRILTGEAIDPSAIAATEAASVGIPGVQAVLLAQTVREIEANLSAGDADLGMRRVELLIHCFRAGH